MQLKSLHAQGFKLPKVTVNVSAMQFNSEFVGTVRSVLQESGLPPASLQLELTEGVVMSDASYTIGALCELKDLGVTLSVDDFGTGYSSLGYIKQLPVSTLKIDQCFVRDIEMDNNDSAIIRAIVTLGHSLDLTIVAEGVETKEQLDFLHTLGCDQVQGYYFSKPLPEDEFTAYMLRQNQPGD